MQPKVKASLHEIWMAEKREDAYKAFDNIQSPSVVLNIPRLWSV